MPCDPSPSSSSAIPPPRRTEHPTVPAGELSLYLDDLSSYPQLSQKQVEALDRRDPNKVRQALVLGNLRLVISVAKWYSEMGLPLADLVQEGNIGLMRAASRYDFRPNVTFTTYATWWIRQHILRAIMTEGRLIHLPEHFQEEARKLRRVKNQLTQHLGRYPTQRELAAALGETESWIADHEQVPTVTTSLSEIVNESEYSWSHAGITVEERYATVEEAQVFSGIFDELDRQELYAHMRAILTTREWMTLVLGYGLNGQQPWTLQRIANELNISRRRVRQIQQRALEKLGKQLTRQA